MKAMLIWSDGAEISTYIFEDKDGKTGYERAVEQMHLEYDDHNSSGNASEDFGAHRGDTSCVYSAEDEDMCTWRVKRIPEEGENSRNGSTSYADTCELFGHLIDVVEDWLEKKGILPKDIPNKKRDLEDCSAIIYGEDYDYLADRFSETLGISRTEGDYEEVKEMELE